MRASPLRLLALAALLVSCRTPTSVTLVLSSDVACDDHPATSVAVSRASDEMLSPALVTSVCQPDGHIGTVVVVPASRKDEDLRVRVVTSVGEGTSCEPPAYGPGCIVSRRQLRFLAHEELTVPISQRVDCAGVACGATTTCRQGACVASQVDVDQCQAHPEQCGIEIAPDPVGGAGGAGGAGGSGGSGGSGGQPSVRKVSSWVGTNISGDLPRTDVAFGLQPFDTPAAQKDASGYPAPGQSGQSASDVGFVLPSGTYKLSYKGSGAVTIDGIGALKNESVDGEVHRADVDITATPGEFGHFLNLHVTSAPGQSVSDIHLFLPGFDDSSKQLFLPQFLAALRPFRTLRFMDWEATNGNTLTDWSQRATTARFGAQAAGEPWEHIVALINQTGKDAWLTVPEHATDDFVTQMATYVAANLDRGSIDAVRAAAGVTEPFQVIIEPSNEPWNTSTSAYKTFLAEAQKDPARYTGVYDGPYASFMSGNADLMRVGQFQADRLVKHAAVFRKVFKAAGFPDATVAPALSGWSLAATYSDVGLRFIKTNYGDPKDLITYIAIAPYFQPADDQTGTLTGLFAASQADIASKDAAFADFSQLTRDYGLSMAAYEGGQGLSGTTNQSIKHLAQHDQRMYDAYMSYFALWQKNFGKSLFVHFNLAGAPNAPEFTFQYGYWGSLQGVLEDTTACVQNLPVLTGSEALADVVHRCPKYRALAGQVP